MSALIASHYLRIYRIKLAMAQDGTTNPAPQWVDFMRRLIANLESLDPNAEIRLEATLKRVCFSHASTGSILAQFEGITDV
jgi:hypothetical protein